jgi:hypothetical protein
VFAFSVPVTPRTAFWARGTTLGQQCRLVYASQLRRQHLPALSSGHRPMSLDHLEPAIRRKDFCHSAALESESERFGST